LAGRRFARAQVCFEAHVHGDDDQINFLFVAQHCDPLLRFADGFAKLQPRVVLSVLPVGYARRRQTEYADAHAVHFLNQIRLIGRLVRARAIGVSRKPREARFAARLVKYGQSEIVFVIAHGHRVVAERIHREHHRVGRRVVEFVVEVFERRALYGVAGIEEECLWVFFTNLRDDGGRFGEAAHVRFVRVVVERQDVAV
jgi:hypothetical protein